MKTRTSTIVAASVLAGGLVLAGTAAAGHLNPVLEGDLSGRAEVATDASNRRIVGDPNASGEAYVFGIDNDSFGGMVESNADTLCYLILVDGISELDQLPGNGRAAHIHEGVEGENGPVVATLAFPTDGQAADCLTEGEDGKFAPPNAGPDSGIVKDILDNPEEYYVNVHNSEYPGGAVRAQLSAAHGG